MDDFFDWLSALGSFWRVSLLVGAMVAIFLLGKLVRLCIEIGRLAGTAP